MEAKKLITFLLAAAMALSMAACAGSSSEAPSAANATTSSDAAPGELGGKLSIWSWGAGAEKTAREDAVKLFIEAHPEIEVEHIVLPTTDAVWDQKSAAAYAAGNAGDVMQMSPDYYGKITQYFEDLGPYIERDGIDLETAVTPGLMNGYYRPSGKLEALPLLANCFVFAYNKDLFDSVGVPYPTDDWTWTDVAEMAPKFVSGEGANHVYFMVNHWVTPNFSLISQGGVPYTDDFKTALLDSPEVAAGLDLFGGLVKAEAMPNDVAAKNMPKEQLFVSGKAAVYPVGGFEASTIANEVGENFQWGAVLPPKDPNGKNINLTYATGYAMNAASGNKEAAWQFLKEVSFENADMARVTAQIGMPANRAVAENEYSAITSGSIKNEMYVRGMESSRLNLFGGALSSAGDQWKLMWESVTINGTSGKEAQDEYFSLVAKAFSELNIE